MNRILLMVIRNFWKVPGAWFKICRHAKHPERYSEREKYDHIQYILKTAVETGNIDLQVHGKDNIPKENGFLIYANHQGLFDIMAIAASCDNPWAAVLKKELYNIPFMKQMVDSTGSYPMDREDLRQSMQVINAVTKEVQNGRNFLIFPEGTRSKMGNKMIDFHSGSFKCATKSKAPIVPVALIDSYKVLDEKGSRQVALQIHYLPVITYDEYQGMNTVELAGMVRSRIEATIEKYAAE